MTGREGPDDYPVPLPGAVPTCPHCWNHDGRAGPANGTYGRYECPCGTLFNGGRAEWEHWRARREALRARATAARDALVAKGYDFDHAPPPDHAIG